MFTVIICDNKIIDDCKEKYGIYLKPFLDNSEIEFCAWNINGMSLDEAVPDLRDKIDGIKDWRAIVVLDQYAYGGKEYIYQRNPFDYVQHIKIPDRDFSSKEECEDFVKAKIEAYNTALENPLARLAIWLLGTPIKNASIKGIEDIVDLSDDNYFELLNQRGLRSLDVECDRLRVKKFELLKSHFEIHGEIFNLPKQFYALSERVFSPIVSNSVEKKHTESNYTRFYEDNLYPNAVRYLLFDMPYVKNTRDEGSYLSFLTFLMIFSANEISLDVTKPYRVYNVKTIIDSTRVTDLCNRYDVKLRTTLSKIEFLKRKNELQAEAPIDDETAQKLFESHITVPVNIKASIKKKDLMAKYDRIGLSVNCPGDEYSYWDNQYREITKLFIRYLREPRRAVKTSIKEFHFNDTIDDERTIRMNEFQKEDVVYSLLEEEQKMIETTTTHLFRTQEYRQRMDKADKEVRKGIGRRMTRRKTVCVGTISLLAYFIGFLPVVFSNIHTIKSLLFSLLVTLVMCGMICLIGFVYLFKLKAKLVNRFKHFNYEMSGICSEIERGLLSFSKYLSHACNVMRDHSVLRYKENAFSKNQKVLCKHEYDIKCKMEEVNRLFSNYIDTTLKKKYVCEPYDYNFSVLCDYEYEVPYSNSGIHIEFLQTGNEIIIPVDYVDSITLTREELYD